MIPEKLRTTDGLQLHVQHWHIENPKAAVLLIHGLGEHIGRYEHIASALNQAGYAAVGMDHRTHGKSEGEPRMYVTDIDIFVNDLEILWRHIQETHPEKPLFVFGHSMGGLLAVRFALRHQNDMQGLVTSAAGLAPGKSITPLMVMIARIIGKLAPKARISSLDTEMLSHDPAVVQKYNSDPLIYHDKTRAGFGLALLNGVEDALARVHTLRLPMLILHGGADEIVDPIASRMLHEKAGSADKTLTIYPDLYHEILNEPQGDEILTAITGWLDAHLPA